MELEARLLASLEAEIAANRLILPSLPDVALEVRAVVQRGNASMQEVVRIIARDPAISARVLKVANSALMRGRQPIEELKGAVTRLGLRLVGTLINTLAIIQTLQQGDAPLRRQLREISDHSREIAALCHALAAEYTALLPEEAMLAGLIHDIGKLPLLTHAAEMNELNDHGELPDEVCHRLHAQVGARVLETWGFSLDLIGVAREHEEIDRPGEDAPQLVDLVIVAHLLACASLPRYSGWNWERVPAVRRLGLVDKRQPVSEQRYRDAREMLGE